MEKTPIMRQAIRVKFLPPTNSKGARVKAIAQAGSVTLPWDYELDAGPNHYAACLALMAKFDWQKYHEVRGGWDDDGSSVWVMVPTEQGVR